MNFPKQFCTRLLAVILYLAERVFPIEPITETTVILTIRFDGIVITGDLKAMELREGQQATVTAALKTKAGHDAAYEKGSVKWSSSDESIASVTADEGNELSATVKGVDGSSNGSALITFEADGDPDADETRDIVGTLAVTVTQGEAVVVELSAGAASDTPDESAGSTGSETPADTTEAES